MVFSVKRETPYVPTATTKASSSVGGARAAMRH
jgi:hypothetical protein